MDSPRDPGERTRSALIARVARWFRPPRTLRPTRAGWSFFAFTFGVGFAALNTGNNLLYLVLSLMLSFLVLSGVLSESAVRGVSVRRRLPREIFAGSPAPVLIEISNTQRRIPSFAIVVEDRVREHDTAAKARAAGRVFALRVDPGDTHRDVYRFEAERRGYVTFVGFRVSTRFPFGLFLKSLIIDSRETSLVYPAVEPVAAPHMRGSANDEGERHSDRLGEGSAVGGLRDFANGDPLRRIQWRTSFRRGSLVVREVETERNAEVEVQLRTRGHAAAESFERAVRWSASEVVALIDAGAHVALRTERTHLASGTGLQHRARLLSFLALAKPESESAAEVP